MKPCRDYHTLSYWLFYKCMENKNVLQQYSIYLHLIVIIYKTANLNKKDINGDISWLTRYILSIHGINLVQSLKSSSGLIHDFVRHTGAALAVPDPWLCKVICEGPTQRVFTLSHTAKICSSQKSSIMTYIKYKIASAKFSPKYHIGWQYECWNMNMKYFCNLKYLLCMQPND